MNRRGKEGVVVLSLAKGLLHYRATILLAFIALSVSGLLSAQTTSTVEGTVIDKQGLPIVGAEVQVVSETLATNRKVVTNGVGFYQISTLPAGTYTLTASAKGFHKTVLSAFEITLNRTLRLNVKLEVGSTQEEVEVMDTPPLLETETSSSGSTILPTQIQDLPINGRNYLDLLQLVPGVAINRQQDPGSDSATPVLGERAGNTNFLIDGLPNRDDLNGGPAAQFNQETISEFQVITTGYKAEFGNASGGVVNVITKSGTNKIHGMASGFHRNSAFDSSNIEGKDVPSLLRWDYSLAAGGPLVRDKVFWFASAERIDERRELNFQTPLGAPQIILDQEKSYDTPTLDKETRLFGRLDQNWKRHQFREQVNYTNAHINNFLPLSQATNLPSTRRTLGNRILMLGFSDTWLAGDASNPYVLNFRGQFRREPAANAPAHPQAGPFTYFNIFSSYTTGGVFGDINQIFFGSNLSAGNIDQTYGNASASVEKNFGKHTLKMGWDFVRTIVDGREAATLTDQLFATLPDYATFGPIDSGLFTLTSVAGAPPNGDQIHIRNNYNGLFLQDDWKLLKNLTLNLGVRWDYDSRFEKLTNVSPRLGFAWSPRPNTIVRGSWGYFYDHFRLGIARDIPGFGGADMRLTQPLSFPRLFYGVPSIAPALFGLCLSPTETDAQLASEGATCPYPFYPGSPIYGVDHLSGIVAAGHEPIPSNVVVTLDNVQTLTGLTPQEFADQASVAVAQQPGYWSWGPYGALSFPLLMPAALPSLVDSSFDTPYTRSFSVGIQQQFASDLVISLDYYHKDIRNMLGNRQTNLPFDARVNGSTVPFVNGYGPWYSGRYNAGVIAVNKRLSHRFAIGGSYTWASGIDDALCANFDSSPAATCGYPTDSFRGMTTLVTDPNTGQTNANGSFIASNGNYVPKAGIYYDGAKLDGGPSDLFLRHTFEVHGTVQLPWKVELSSLFRAQSGYRYTQSAQVPVDQDGNQNYGGRDLKTGRNQFTAPGLTNTDLRVARTFKIGERVSMQGLFEFFNLFNVSNPAAVQTLENAAPPQPFGTVIQKLPGREGQIGLRIQF